jgi:hypothetical protein
VCPGGNATPLFDNIAVGVTAGVDAPQILFAAGTRYQDRGSYPSELFDVRAPGPADVARDVNMDSPAKPDRCGDSLVVVGPAPGSDPNENWEARMWWRVAKRSPFQWATDGGVDTRYRTWRDRVSDDRLIDRDSRPEFTWGWMDTAEAGLPAITNQVHLLFSRTTMISPAREQSRQRDDLGRMLFRAQRSSTSSLRISRIRRTSSITTRTPPAATSGSSRCSPGCV